MAKPLSVENVHGRLTRSKNPNHPSGYYDRLTGRPLPRPRTETELERIPLEDRNLTEIALTKARRYGTIGFMKSPVFKSKPLSELEDEVRQLRIDGRDKTQKGQNTINWLRLRRSIETIAVKKDLSRTEAVDVFSRFFDALAEGMDPDEARDTIIDT